MRRVARHKNSLTHLILNVQVEYELAEDPKNADKQIAVKVTGPDGEDCERKGKGRGKGGKKGKGKGKGKKGKGSFAPGDWYCDKCGLKTSFVSLA